MSFVTWFPRREARRYRRGSLAEERHVRGPPADVHDHHAQLLLLRGQHRPAGRQGLEHQVVHMEAGAGAAS